MCRWVAYLGQPVFMEEFVSKPCQSLVAQSRHCLEAKTEVNADGFGLGWYSERARPGLFRDIRPAWSDENLLSIAHQIRSPLFFAHVRASTGTATTRANCHPFAVDTWLFMHNGQIPGWERLRRRIEAAIPDHLFTYRGGTTDSEAIFLLLLANGLADDAQAAMRRTVAFIEAERARAGIEEPVKLTAAVSNGKTLHAIRYASDAAPPTLYTRHTGSESGTLVVSEPLDGVSHGWEAVPPQSVVAVTAQGAKVSGFQATPARNRQRPAARVPA
jgi:glutamine amidotransferase